MVRSFYCASYSDNPAIATPLLGQGIIVCTPDTLENAKSRDVLSGNWRQFCPQLHIYMCLSDRISQSMHQEGRPCSGIWWHNAVCFHCGQRTTTSNGPPAIFDDDAATPFLCITFQHEPIQLHAAGHTVITPLLSAGWLHFVEMDSYQRFVPTSCQFPTCPSDIWQKSAWILSSWHPVTLLFAKRAWACAN